MGCGRRGASGNGDGGTRRQGDRETRRQGDEATKWHNVPDGARREWWLITARGMPAADQDPTGYRRRLAPAMGVSSLPLRR
jgi:hypothetical protein